MKNLGVISCFLFLASACGSSSDVTSATNVATTTVAPATTGSPTTGAAGPTEAPQAPESRRPLSARTRAARRAKGSLDQSWPSTGTTSVWPESITPPGSGGPMVAIKSDFAPSGDCAISACRPCPARYAAT